MFWDCLQLSHHSGVSVLSEAMERLLGLEQQKWMGSPVDQKGLKDLNGEFWSKNY